MVKHLPAVQETWIQSLGWEHPLEKEMATHSSTLAKTIPWTEEPGRLQSLGSQRVRHNWATSLFFFLRFPLYTVSGEFFHKWMLNFIKSFFCIYWDDHLSLSLSLYIHIYDFLSCWSHNCKCIFEILHLYSHYWF